jgi:hypothetical protein
MPPGKYTIAQLEGFLTSGQIDPFLWMMHFPDTLDRKIPTCEDCVDFQDRSCPGGRDPIDCFLSDEKRSDFV